MLDKESLKPVIESLIFAAESAISFEKIANVLEGEDRAIVKEALGELMEDYRARSGGIFIEEVANGFQFRTNSEFAPWLRKFFKIGMQKISKAAMESLAVIAYKQPVTRGEIEAIRGVDSGGVLATLMEKRFIKIVGRKEVPGRPVVYGTTKEFLETFDLKDLSCLPSLKDIQKLEEEYAQKEGQSAEDTVEDTVQGAEASESGVQDEVQESIQDGTGEEGGETLQASAEDSLEADWEETVEDVGVDAQEIGVDSEDYKDRTGADRPEAGAEADGRADSEDYQNGTGPDRPEAGAEAAGREDSEDYQNGTGADRPEAGAEAHGRADSEDYQDGTGADRPEAGAEAAEGTDPEDGGEKAGSPSQDAEAAGADGARPGEASEDNSERGDNIEEEG